MDYVKEFHNQFVIVPVDKAAKNIGIICKLFYLQVLKGEILSSGNVIHSNKTINNIVHGYYSLIKEKCNIISTSTTYLIYSIPRDFRFITSGRLQSSIQYQKKIGNGLQSMLKLEKAQCNFNHKYDGIKNNYITVSDKEVIDFMVASNLLNDGYKYN